jgi:hypothetical protein
LVVEVVVVTITTQLPVAGKVVKAVALAVVEQDKQVHQVEQKQLTKVMTEAQTHQPAQPEAVVVELDLLAQMVAALVVMVAMVNHLQ